MVQKLKLEHENNNGQEQLCFFYYQVRRFFQNINGGVLEEAQPLWSFIKL